MANVNPFRYRGYYYDEEIELYYLQSRYYNPEIGRFLNVDSIQMINNDIFAFSLYCYCGNLPVNRIDLHGCIWWKVLATVAIAVAVVAAVVHIANAVLSLRNNEYNRSNDTSEIVSNQDDIKMGFGATTFAKVGCGAAATHNAIILAGGNSKLSDVVKFMEAHDMTFGFAGAYFTNIQLYLKRKGYSSKLYLRKIKGNIDDKIKKSKRNIAILAYKHSTSGHYVAIEYKNKKFKKYNSNMELASIDSWISKKSYKPWCLITI